MVKKIKFIELKVKKVVILKIGAVGKLFILDQWNCLRPMKFGQKMFNIVLQETSDSRFVR